MLHPFLISQENALYYKYAFTLKKVCVQSWLTLQTSLPLSFYNETLLSSPTEPRDGVKRAQNYITATVKPYSTKQCLCITGAFKSQQKPLVHGVKFIPCCVTQSLHKPQWHFGQGAGKLKTTSVQRHKEQTTSDLSSWTICGRTFLCPCSGIRSHMLGTSECSRASRFVEELTWGINQKLILNTIFTPRETIKIILVPVVGSTFTKRVLWNPSANKKRLSRTNKRPYRCPRAPITPRTQLQYIGNETFPESSDSMLICSLI